MEQGTSFKPVEALMQTFHQPSDIPKGERPQDGTGVGPPFGFPQLDVPLPTTASTLHTTLLPAAFYSVSKGNLASSSTLGNSQQYSHQFLAENSSAEYAYPGFSIEALGSSSTHFTAPREVPLNDCQNPIPHLPSHGMTTARSDRRRLPLFRFHRGSRTTRNTPVSTSHPYRRPPHTESAYPTDLVPDTNLNTPLNINIAPCMTVAQSTAKLELVLTSTVDNDFYRKASDEYITSVPFNFMARQEENTTHAALSQHDDYNALLVTHPPPSTLVIAPLNAFDPPIPQPMYHPPDPQATIDPFNSFPVPPPPPSQPDRGSLADQSTGTIDKEIDENMYYDENMAKWVCRKCEKDNSRKQRMRDHVAYCLGYRLYLCDGSCGVDDCPQEFRTNGYLFNHQNPKFKECLLCPLILHRQNLQRHMEKIHGQRA